MSITSETLVSAREIARARALIESQGLLFEQPLDDLLGIYEEGRLVATGARLGYVFKMLAVEPEHQSGAVIGVLISELIRLGRQAGEDAFFIFTRPEHAPSFEHFNFRLLVTDGPVSLLEYGGGLESWLRAHAGLVHPGHNGAVVINANPLTLGHLYLIETAAAAVDHLYVFVVREDRSVFPFEVRYRLIEESTRHLKNVLVLDTSRYAISAGTFPTYFLKKVEAVALAQMRIDLLLFAAHLAPYFFVRKRFVGHEPFCPLTDAYNRTMAEVLPEYGIERVEIPRTTAGGSFISATRVREAVTRQDWNVLATLVPPATLEYLRSPEGMELARKS